MQQLDFPCHPLWSLLFLPESLKAQEWCKSCSLETPSSCPRLILQLEMWEAHSSLISGHSSFCIFATSVDVSCMRGCISLCIPTEYHLLSLGLIWNQPWKQGGADPAPFISIRRHLIYCQCRPERQTGTGTAGVGADVMKQHNIQEKYHR